MPAIERVIPLVGQLPASIREPLIRRLHETAGLVLIGFASLVALALMTWSVQDPSLSHATSGTIRNLIGYPGAIGSDLLMQILGLGSIMLILPIAVWGWRMLTHRHFDREGLRFGCWILGTVLATGLYLFFVFGYLARRCERQADLYGCGAASREAFMAALEKVARINGIPRDHPGWFSRWLHPTIGQRIDFLERAGNASHPEFHAAPEVGGYVTADDDVGLVHK